MTGDPNDGYGVVRAVLFCSRVRYGKGFSPPQIILGVLTLEMVHSGAFFMQI